MEYKSNLKKNEKNVKRMNKMHTAYIIFIGMSFCWLVRRNASENFNL